MIDLKQLREDPDRFRLGAERKGVSVDIKHLLELDDKRRSFQTEIDRLRAEQNKLAKESGPKIGQLMGQIKKAAGAEKDALEREAAELRAAPARLKEQIQQLEHQSQGIEPELHDLLLQVPMPADPDVPVGKDASDNIELRTWAPTGFDASRGFEACKGFAPKTHMELMDALGMVDFERGVKIAGSRSYILKDAGMRLHQAVLRFALDFIADKHGFTTVSVPVIVREECMVGTGFFPAGREQTYHIEESTRGGGYDMFLTGTGEVGLMGIHADEILDESQLPIKMATVSTCFRREAGAAGRDTAGLYRIHQFDKVEQVVICKADEAESRAWHKKMIAIVEELLQALELPYRLLQCCTGDLGVKNADMVDVECWMPGRGDLDQDGRPLGAYGETHSASRLYDFQCRRLNMRYKGDSTGGKTVFCHSLNNTVVASPRILIPIVEMHQQADGSVRIPAALRPYMGGLEVIQHR